MLSKELLVNREISWLGFNKRVLQEAFRMDVPLRSTAAHPRVVW